MIHLKKDYETYYYFSRMILYMSDTLFKDKDYSVKNLKLIITDDDAALNEALRNSFERSDFALCCNHIRKNIIRILKNFELEETDEEKILNLIFGSSNNRVNCLISSTSKNEYMERLETLIEYFDSIEHKKNAKSFGDWFLKNKAKKLFDYFISPNTKHLDKLRNYYTTNDVESFNKSIKDVITKKCKNNLTEIFDFFEEMSNMQITNCELAIRESGIYEVAFLYENFKIRLSVWSTLSKDTQEKKIKKFFEQ